MAKKMLDGEQTSKGFNYKIQIINVDLVCVMFIATLQSNTSLLSKQKKTAECCKDCKFKQSEVGSKTLQGNPWGSSHIILIP